MLSLYNKCQKQLLCDVHKISRDSLYPALSYHKNWRPFCTNNTVYIKRWYWRVSKNNLFLIQFTNYNFHYHHNTNLPENVSSVYDSYLTYLLIPLPDMIWW